MTDGLLKDVGLSIDEISNKPPIAAAAVDAAVDPVVLLET